MARQKKQKQQEAGAPAWMVTYGDAMTLLLCFFVIIVSMSELKKDQKFMQVVESLQAAFGAHKGGVGAVPLSDAPTNVILKRLLELEIPKEAERRGDTDTEAIEGKKWRVTQLREGIQVVVGGRIAFDRFSATLKPEAKELIAKGADVLRGYNTKIRVRGHATREPLPGDSVYPDARDLSYARAKAVEAELIRNGVRAERLMLEALGSTEPLVRQAYTEDRRALNRRVEVVVTEELIEDYAGSTLDEDEKESSDGR